ncbi:charged multivesicular body protein 1a-like [Sycon ciliatum]|uniref:charged multivesicular body protein 1a-like n=1 Tax=Sycon ciliatum TaxID=27933 RepID=UPI0020AC93E0|eukprot:scpid95257/ scgid21457/ Charged multivesicular body protein 1a; Chromatin-modifying protein 1a
MASFFGGGGGKSLEDTMFDLKFTMKQMERASKKCEKEEKAQKSKVKKALEQKNTEGARIYAENAIRKKNEGLNYLRMSARIDAVSQRVQTAMMMKQTSKQMAGVVKGMDKVLQGMDLQKIAAVMDKFESQFEHLDTHTQVMENSMSAAMTLSTPENQVESLMQEVAEESGLDIIGQLGSAKAPRQGEIAPAASDTLTQNEEDQLSRRLAQLREA